MTYKVEQQLHVKEAEGLREKVKQVSRNLNNPSPCLQHMLSRPKLMWMLFQNRYCYHPTGVAGVEII